MNDYSKRLSTVLAALGVAVEAVSTGGGCAALATADHRFLITNGDSALPDGKTSESWETLALVCDYGENGENGEEIAALEVRDLVGDTVPVVAHEIAQWILARR